MLILMIDIFENIIKQKKLTIIKLLRLINIYFMLFKTVKIFNIYIIILYSHRYVLLLFFFFLCIFYDIVEMLIHFSY